MAMAAKKTYPLQTKPLPVLPPFQETTISGEFYGDLTIFANYCGLPNPPVTSDALIQHGWGLPHDFIDPLLIIGRPIQHPRQPLLVSTREIEAFCRERGYVNAHAVGLPIAYLRDQQLSRIPNSLLIMPAHTLPGMKPLFSVDRYVSAIESIRSDFDQVAVCVHRHCMEHSELPDAFRRVGITVIEGAHTTDRNALQRIATLMSTFEYVTSNGIGSHLAYSAAFGAKPSIWGEFAEVTPDSLRRVWLYANHPDLLRKVAGLTTETTIRHHFSEFFVPHPKDAIRMVDWGKNQIGSDRVRPPNELRAYLGWDLPGRCRIRAKPILQKLSREAKRSAARIIKILPRGINEKIFSAKLKKNDVQATQLWIRLNKHGANRYVTQTVPLLGLQFKVADIQSFTYCFEEIFINRIYEFVTLRDDPRIIDGGANVGVSLLFFKHMYPKSRIVAFEPDPNIFAVLEHNCKTYQLEGVELHKKALWSEETTLRFKQEGADAGRLNLAGEIGSELAVKSVRLSTHLEQQVDFLKLDVEGAEFEVLKECGPKLRNAKHIFVEYHGFANRRSRCGEVISILENNGFSIHVHAGPLVSPKPFRSIEANGLGMDLLLHIFAIRDD